MIRVPQFRRLRGARPVIAKEREDRLSALVRAATASAVTEC